MCVYNIYIYELRTNFCTWQRDILKYGGPLSILQWWQPHDPLNTTLVLPKFVRYSNISYIFIHCIVYEYMMNMIFDWICIYTDMHGIAWLGFHWKFTQKSTPKAASTQISRRNASFSSFIFWLSAIALWLQQFRSNQESPDPNTWQEAVRPTFVPCKGATHLDGVLKFDAHYSSPNEYWRDETENFTQCSLHVFRKGWGAHASSIASIHTSQNPNTQIGEHNTINKKLVAYGAKWISKY